MKIKDVKIKIFPIGTYTDYIKTQKSMPLCELWINLDNKNEFYTKQIAKKLINSNPFEYMKIHKIDDKSNEGKAIIAMCITKLIIKGD